MERCSGGLDGGAGGGESSVGARDGSAASDSRLG